VSAATLSQRQLNRALLARQQLLERSTLALPELLEQVGGLQMQYAPSGYVGLWSRLAGFERDALTGALERREVIQATLMRSTIHLVSAADYWPLTEAIRRTRREWFERVSRREIGKFDMRAVADAARAELAGGPLRMKVLITRLAQHGHAEQAAKWVGSYVDLVRVPPSGTWQQRRADLYGLAEHSLPRPSGLGEDEGLELVLRRYLGAFGPATAADIGSWAGLPPALLRPIINRLELRRFRDEQGRGLIDLPDAPLPDPETPAPVRFLPTWDATLLVHARRAQVLPEHHRPRVFSTRTPQSVPTFLVDGQVAGTWRNTDGRIELSPFESVPQRAQAELAEEADRLARFHAD
jgi:hypothetical protein